MEYSEILVEKLDRVLKITLNRPHYRNAIGRITIEELDDAFMTAADDDEVGVIVLCAKGDHFSGGHDIGTPEKVAEQLAPYAEKGC